MRPEAQHQYGKAGFTPLPYTTPLPPQRPSLTRRASRIMRLANFLVSGLLCLATVVALVAPLGSRDGVLSTFTYEVHILLPHCSLSY